jgi:hypothetical protein
MLAMDFADDVRAGIEVNKPVRVAVAMSLETLPKLYSGESPMGPPRFLEYAENPARLEVAGQIYEYLFEPISLDSLRKIVRHGTYIAHTEGGPKTIPTVEEMNSPSWVMDPWTTYVITFDYYVPLGDEDPNAVQLTVGKDLRVTGRPHRLEKERWTINETLKELPGMLKEYYGREALLGLREDFYRYERARQERRMTGPDNHF